MNEQVLSDFLVSMEQEISLLKAFYADQSAMLDSLYNRDWDAAKQASVNMGDVSISVQKAEKIRHTKCAALAKEAGVDSTEDFQEILFAMPHSQKEYAQGLYLELRNLVSSIENVNCNMGIYMRTIGSVYTKIIEELFPQKKQVFYSKNGEPRQAADGPVILNHRQ